MWRAPNGLAAIRAILRYIAATTKRLDKEELRDAVNRLAAPIEGMMDTLADQLEELFMDKGIERGEIRGRREGRRDMLVRLLQKRFGDLPETTQARLDAADVADLETWADRVLTAQTLEGVLTED